MKEWNPKYGDYVTIIPQLPNTELVIYKIIGFRNIFEDIQKPDYFADVCRCEETDLYTLLRQISPLYNGIFDNKETSIFEFVEKVLFDKFGPTDWVYNLKEKIPIQIKYLQPVGKTHMKLLED